MHFFKCIDKKRRSVAHANVDRKFDAIFMQQCAESLALTKCDFVQRRLAADRLVVMHNFFEALRRNRNPRGHSRKKRTDFFRRTGTTESDEKNGVVGHAESLE